MIDGGHTDRPRAVFMISCHRSQTSQPLYEHVLTGSVYVGTSRAIARSRRIDDSGILRLDRLIPQTQSIHDPGPKILGHYIRAHHQLASDLQAAFRFQIQRQTPLVTVRAQK